MSSFHQLTIGGPVPVTSNAAAFQTGYTFANTNDQVEFIFQVPDPGDGTRSVTITQLGYRLSSVVGTSPVMKISLQGVDGSGQPDGTIKSAAGAFATFTPAGTNTWNWVTLGSSYVAAAGEFLAIVISYSSGTLNAGTASPIITHTFFGGQGEQFPFFIKNVATVRDRTNTNRPLYGFRDASRAYGNPIQTITATAFSTAAERAMRFIFDAAQVAQYKIEAVRMFGTTPAAAKNLKMFLYNGTTVIATATIDSDYFRVAAGVGAWTFRFQDSPLPTLVGGQEYRVSLAPQDATNNVAWTTFDVAQASDMDAFPGGQQWYLSTRATGGATAWTDVLTSRPVAELIIQEWTAPSRGVIG